MIVGTITLLTILFMGGVQQTSFINKLENGVKQYVLDKDRSKEILADLKESMHVINNFNKDRKAKLKQFYEMNLDRDMDRGEMLEFFEVRMKERVSFQNDILTQRLEVVAKIQPEEWANIISMPDEFVQKAEEKGAKDPFDKVIDTIYKTIKEIDRQAQVLALVQNFKLRYNKLGTKLNTIITKESDLLTDQNSSREQFMAVGSEMNELRRVTFTAMVDLHFDILDATTKEEWPKIMAAINKVIK